MSKLELENIQRLLSDHRDRPYTPTRSQAYNMGGTSSLALHLALRAKVCP